MFKRTKWNKINAEQEQNPKCTENDRRGGSEVGERRWNRSGTSHSDHLAAQSSVSFPKALLINKQTGTRGDKEEEEEKKEEEEEKKEEEDEE